MKLYNARKKTLEFFLLLLHSQQSEIYVYTIHVIDNLNFELLEKRKEMTTKKSVGHSGIESLDLTEKQKKMK